MEFFADPLSFSQKDSAQFMLIGMLVLAGAPYVLYVLYGCWVNKILVDTPLLKIIFMISVPVGITCALLAVITSSDSTAMRGASAAGNGFRILALLLIALGGIVGTIIGVRSIMLNYFTQPELSEIKGVATWKVILGTFVLFPLLIILLGFLALVFLALLTN